jgi:hypothetical protein
MRRAAAIAMAAMSLLVLAMPTAFAVGDDTSGPGCVEVLDGSAGFDGSTLSVRLVLAAPSCRQATYTVVVYDDVAGTQLLTTVSVRGDGSVDPTFGPTVQFVIPVSDVNGDGLVCFVATTSIGPRSFDRAPDEGCADVAIGSAPAKKIS